MSADEKTIAQRVAAAAEKLSTEKQEALIFYAEGVIAGYESGFMAAMAQQRGTPA